MSRDRTEVASKMAICPYYKRETSRTVICESGIEAEFTVQCFRGRTYKQRWEHDFCYTWFWRNCPHAAECEERNKLNGS